MQFWGLRFLLLIDFSTAFNFFFQNVMTSPIFSSCQIRWGWQDECVGKVWFVSFRSYKHRSSGEKLSGWGDREYLSTEKKRENSFYVLFQSTQWMPWQYSLYLRHWSRHPNLVNTWHQKYFIFVRMMANILRDKLISFGWLFAFSYTLFWIWSLQVVFEVSLLLQQQHCCTTLVFCHSYALNELSTLAAALACLHKAKLSKKSVSKTVVQVLLIHGVEKSRKKSHLTWRAKRATFTKVQTELPDRLVLINQKVVRTNATFWLIFKQCAHLFLGFFSTKSDVCVREMPVSFVTRHTVNPDIPVSFILQPRGGGGEPSSSTFFPSFLDQKSIHASTSKWSVAIKAVRICVTLSPRNFKTSLPFSCEKQQKGYAESEKGHQE